MKNTLRIKWWVISYFDLFSFYETTVQGCQAILKQHMMVDSALTIINYDTLDQTRKHHWWSWRIWIRSKWMIADDSWWYDMKVVGHLTVKWKCELQLLSSSTIMCHLTRFLQWSKKYLCHLFLEHNGQNSCQRRWQKEIRRICKWILWNHCCLYFPCQPWNIIFRARN